MVKRRTAEWQRFSTGRVRALIEDPEAEWSDDFARYRAAGIEVAVCSGPGRPGSCPHLIGQHCELWDEADIVLFALPRDEPAGRLVLRTGRRHHPAKPVLLESTEADHRGPPAPPAQVAQRIAAITGELAREEPV